MRLRNKKLIWGALMLGLGGVLALSGCGTMSEPEPALTSSSAQPTTLAESSASPIQIVMPKDCSAMNSVANSEATAAIANLGLESSIGETDLTSFNESAGPIAQATMEKAKQVRGCVYPLYLNGQNITEWVAELTQADQKPVIDALRSSDYQESKLGEAIRFTLSQHEEDQPGMPGSGVNRNIDYLFISDVWIAIVSSGQQDYAQAALDGLLAANPSLNNFGKSENANDSAGECSGRSGLDMLSEWAPNVQGGPWDTTGQFSDVSGYDGCATLSWIVLRPEPCCTRFSITPVMFFHKGEYVPSATATKYAIDSENPTTRGTDSEVSITFIWQGADIAGPANKTTVTYQWDEKSGTVTRTGDLPPS